jgi:hypothetical protein
MDICLRLILPGRNGPHSSCYLPQHWLLLLCIQIVVNLIELVHFLAVLTLGFLSLDCCRRRTNCWLFVATLYNFFNEKRIGRAISNVLFGWRLVDCFLHFCLYSPVGRKDLQLFLKGGLTRVELDERSMVLGWLLNGWMILIWVWL